MMKKYAEINGKNWEARYPLCSGCENLAIGVGGCLYEGDGCEYPESRTKKPMTIYRAFVKYVDNNGESLETVCQELGDCLDLL
jgi:hypothetical protein